MSGTVKLEVIFVAILLQIRKIDGSISPSFFNNVSCTCDSTDVQFTSWPTCVAAATYVNSSSKTSVNISETTGTVQATVQPTINATGITTGCYVYVGQYEITSSNKNEISGTLTLDECKYKCSVYDDGNGRTCWGLVLIGTTCILYPAINETELRDPSKYNPSSGKDSYIRICVDTTSLNCAAATISVQKTPKASKAPKTTSVNTSETTATVQTTVQPTTNATGITTGVTTQAVTVKKLKPLYLVPCLCPNVAFRQTIEEIIEEITINPKETSKTNRLLISASDSRKSAVGIGAVAVVVLVLPLVIIVCSDLHSLVLHVFSVRKTTRKAKIKP